MSRRFLSYGIVVLLTLVISEAFHPLATIQTMAQPGCRTFTETGKTVCGQFLDYWNTHGGLAQQGFPISGEFTEVNDLNGKPYTVQYFERAVFEKHPENTPPNDVLLSQLGIFQFKRKYPNGEPGGAPPPPAATPTRAASGAPQLQLLDYRTYKTEFGSKYTVGQVKNVGGGDDGTAKVIATYKDAGGKIVGTGSTSCSCILHPGEVFPFVLYRSSSDPDFSTITFQFESGAPSSFDRDYYYTDFQASDINVIPGDDNNNLKVLGTIKNSGTATSSSVDVVVLITDSAGKTLDVSDDYTDASSLAPGQSATFEVSMPGTKVAPNVKVFGYSTKK